MRYLLFFILLFGCAHRREPRKIESWDIQLQGYEKNNSLKKIRDSKKDLWVIDPDPFTSSMVKTLKADEKKIIAYLSIGEAEGYRSYFSKLSKNLLLEENPNWKDNFTVKFWEDEWKNIVLESLRTIQQKGFDGVFLDIIDAFERFPDKKEKAQAMAKLIAEISKKAREKNPDFFVIMQNGIQIRRLLKEPEDLLNSISAINIESVYKERDENLLQDLSFYRKANKLILGLEYFTDLKEREDYVNFAQANGILPLLLNKDLGGMALPHP